MNTSTTQKMLHSSTDMALSPREIAYYNRRCQNRVFNELIEVLYKEIKAGRLSRAELAKRINKRPEQISRWLAGPSNLTLDTISTILIGAGAELDPKVTFLKDRPKRNFKHLDLLLEESDDFLAKETSSAQQSQTFARSTPGATFRQMTK